MDKPNWLNKGDVGYLINDNHVDGPFLFKVIYPDGDYKGTYCLYSSAMTKEQTMIDILPDLEKSIEVEKYNGISTSFEELYKEKYSEINNVFYKNLTFYRDILLFEKTNYCPYKLWFSKDKKLIMELWEFLKNKEINDIRVKFDGNSEGQL